MNIHQKLYNRITEEIGDDWSTITDSDTFGFLFPDMTQEQFDLISAYKVISDSMAPFSDPFVFENIVDALNGNAVDPDDITAPDMDDIMYAVYVMGTLKPNIPFTDDIGKYIAARAMSEGLLYIPPPVQWANEFLPIYGEYIPISKKISTMSRDALLAYSEEEHPEDDDGFRIQVGKLQEILLAYDVKVTQS